jgi:hypothetical protein
LATCLVPEAPFSKSLGASEKIEKIVKSTIWNKSRMEVVWNSGNVPLSRTPLLGSTLSFAL